jgi:hypothetical protein
MQGSSIYVRPTKRAADGWDSSRLTGIFLASGYSSSQTARKSLTQTVGRLGCAKVYLNILSRFVIPGIAFILTLASGFWLSRSGRPYNGLLFNSHKLIALAAVVVAVVQPVGILKSTDLPALSIALLALAALCAAGLFVSGALMSAGKLDHALLHTIHRVALAALVIALPSAVFLLGRSP